MKIAPIGALFTTMVGEKFLNKTSQEEIREKSTDKNVNEIDFRCNDKVVFTVDVGKESFQNQVALIGKQDNAGNSLCSLEMN